LDISAVLVAFIAILVPLLNWWQARKLDVIHNLVNARLSDALQAIEDLKALLLLVLSGEISAEDPRVKEAISRNN
jgi:hypothetical protein